MSPFQFGDAAISLLLFVLSIATLAYNLRSPFGFSGDRQMTTIILVALFFANLVADGHLVQHLCLWFIAIQGVLSHVISGWAKLGSNSWRTGDALRGIMRTKMYGNRTYYEILQRRPGLALGTSWLTIGFESLFLLVFVPKPAITTGVLAIGVLFHLHYALVMRLNLFFWAFIATYPAILYCVSSL